MGKTIIKGNEARRTLQAGVDELADAVKVTLGAKGRNVLISEFLTNDDSNPYDPQTIRLPRLTKDGVTVAKNISFSDPAKDAGSKLIMEAAAKTCEEAGDGTTTTCVLTQAIVKQALRAIDDGVNPIAINNGIDDAVEKVVEYIRENSTDVKGDYSKIKEVASVSANNNLELGKLIADAFKKVGKNGIVSIERGSGKETETDFDKGYSLVNGYVSPYFSNNEKEQCVLKDASVVISDLEINTPGEIENLLKLVIDQEKRETRPFIILCEKMDVAALTYLISNKNKGLKCCVVQVNDIGYFRKMLLEDVAIATGGNFLSKEKGQRIQDIKKEDLGTSKKVVSDMKNTKFIGGNGNPIEIKERIKSIKKSMAAKENKIDTDFYKNRVAKFTGGAATIIVGGLSITEVNEKYDRVEDAICATMSALEEGIVPGAGNMLTSASNVLIDVNIDNDLTAGTNVIFSAIQEPYFAILQNAGMEIEDAIVHEYKLGFGINALTMRTENLLESGIIDPTKVVILSLQNAAAAAKALIMTECLILPEKK